ncbi:MAG: hypothetical protein ACUVWO_12480, partial [Thermodesulfobacteriota bacterium]
NCDLYDQREKGSGLTMDGMKKVFLVALLILTSAIGCYPVLKETAERPEEALSLKAKKLSNAAAPILPIPSLKGMEMQATLIGGDRNSSTGGFRDGMLHSKGFD